MIIPQIGVVSKLTSAVFRESIKSLMFFWLKNMRLFIG